MATATETKRGFKAPCIRCGEEETVMLDLSDLERCTCSSCDAEFTTTEVRAALAAWVKILDWIDLAPVTD